MSFTFISTGIKNKIKLYNISDNNAGFVQKHERCPSPLMPHCVQTVGWKFLLANSTSC